jgi:hypothetical protein
MTEGINDAVQGFLRFFSLDTFSGEKNIFNNFAQGLRELRGTFAKAGFEVAKQVFDAGYEAVKSVRDSVATAIGIDPSTLDAGKAASAKDQMGGQSSGARNAMSSPSGLSNLMPTSSASSGKSTSGKSRNSDPNNSLAHERERLLKQMYSSQQQK